MGIARGIGEYISFTLHAWHGMCTGRELAVDLANSHEPFRGVLIRNRRDLAHSDNGPWSGRGQVSSDAVGKEARQVCHKV